MSDIKNNNEIKQEGTVPKSKAKAVLGVFRVIGKVTLRILSYLMNVILTVLLIGTTCGIIVGTVFCIYLGNYIDPEIDASLFVSASSDSTTRLYYMEYENEEARINEDGTPVEIVDQRLYSTDNSIWVTYEKMPKELIDAFVCVEDHRFFSHNGVDWLRTGNAVLTYFFGAGDFGGSTITQQLIKNLTGDNETTVQRKIQEIFRALHLEKEMSKEDILEMYLNIVFLGNNCYGVQAAANTYFDKDVSELSLVECAALAGIVKNPSQYEPVYHDIVYKVNEDGEMEENGNRARRRTVLYTMNREGKISDKTFDEAWDTELVLAGINKDEETEVVEKPERVNTWYTDAVIEDVQKALMEEYGYTEYVASLMIYTGGLQIYTCMDPEIQQCIDEVYFNDKKDDGYFPYATDGIQPESAMVIIDPYTGDVVGLAGGRGEKTQSRILNRATQAKRPCGSSIKPLSVYAPAIDTGIATMGSVYDDCPVTTSTDGKLWPHNLPDVYHGLTTVQDALKRSVNTCAVKILNDVGVEYTFDFLKNTLDMHSLIESRTLPSGEIVSDIGPAPLALGQFSYGITLWELTAAYGIFQNDGMFCKSRLWYEVLDSEGNVILKNEPEYEMAISPESADIMTKMMQNVIAPGAGGTAAGQINLLQRVDIAGKTGTTTKDFDRTFVAYTPYYVTGCWFGYDQNQSLSNFGKSPAIVVWEKVMEKIQDKIEAKAALTGEPIKKFDFSQNLVEVTYCKDSGMLPCETCSHDPRGGRTETGFFTADSAPAAPCDVHVLVNYDNVTKAIATPNCPAANITDVALVRNEGRNFVCQVNITDAEFTYRSMGAVTKYPTYRGFAYYYYTLPEGTVVGRTGSKVEQFNCACPDHLS
ncbi:MAG: transglycosylase domain-containing protein [Clostridia bacterium]|nr:transglycosylase domain-containing protein [Clostridia bacterium]